MTEGALLTPTKVAKIFDVQPRTVRDWITKGKIVAVKTPTGRWRVPESEVVRLANQMHGSVS